MPDALYRNMLEYQIIVKIGQNEWYQELNMRAASLISCYGAEINGDEVAHHWREATLMRASWWCRASIEATAKSPGRQDWMVARLLAAIINRHLLPSVWGNALFCEEPWHGLENENQAMRSIMSYDAAAARASSSVARRGRRNNATSPLKWRG